MEKAESEWRCVRCGTLLGVEKRGHMHLKYKTAQFIVAGSVLASCRRCGELSETFVGRASSSSSSHAA
jgi:ribosomal protein L37E